MVNLGRVLPENPGNMISVVLKTDVCPTKDDVKRILTELCDKYDRFASKAIPADSVLDSEWVKEDKLDWDYHIGWTNAKNTAEVEAKIEV